MKPILMFTMASCPYCRRAHKLMEELLVQHPAYKDIPIEIIDEVEQPDVANTYDYYYVPTYYVGGIKMFEGAPSREDIVRVYATATEE